MTQRMKCLNNIETILIIADGSHISLQKHLIDPLICSGNTVATHQAENLELPRGTS